VAIRRKSFLANGRKSLIFGRGSWIRTNDLQYPKLPRYQAALYPDHLANEVDTRLTQRQQEAACRVSGR
jgi:hypothetical protein